MSRETRYQSLLRAGFFKSEARELSHTSRAGAHSPYFRRMVNSRHALYLNAKRYGWSEEHYRQAVKQQYIDRGCLKYDRLGRAYADVWKMLRWYEERVPVATDEYTSPWKKKGKLQSAKKKEHKRVSRRQMVKDWIAELSRKIDATESEPRKRQLLEQKRRMEAQLGQME